MRKAIGVITVTLAVALAGFGLILFVGAGLNAGHATQMCRPGDALTVTGGDLPDEVAGYSGKQLVNAATIMRAAADVGMDARGQAIGVMVAMGESSLRNVPHGDAARADTIGLFQTGPEWGSYDERMDPYQATVLFYERLTAVEDWQSLPPTIAGHRAQRNADPLHYQEHWSPAIEVVEALAGQTGRPGLDGESQLNLGPVKPHTQALADEVAARFDLAPGDVGGYRESAVDSGGHPAGLAVDFMTYEDRELGDRIVDYLVEHADRLSVDYIIWRQAIWRAADPEAGWQTMEDRGDDTANHYDHPHVNVLPSPSAASPVGGMGCLLASADNASGAAGDGEWVQPADGPITSRYGPRWGSFHAGIDFGAPCGTPIYAASNGVVTYTGNGHSRYGLTGHVIVIDHGDGVETTYNHMYANGVGVRPGQQVQPGEVIGAVGNDGNSTGCHLHYGVYLNGQHTDPAQFMTGHGVPLG